MRDAGYQIWSSMYKVSALPCTIAPAPKYFIKFNTDLWFKISNRRPERLAQRVECILCMWDDRVWPSALPTLTQALPNLGIEQNFRNMMKSIIENCRKQCLKIKFCHSDQEQGNIVSCWLPLDSVPFDPPTSAEVPPSTCLLPLFLTYWFNTVVKSSPS